jgi:NADH:ubiquinone oxidoreductase subunit 6 (subunit J)
MFDYIFLFIIFLLSIIICCGSNIILSLISFIGIILNLFIFLYWYNIDFLALIFLIIYIGAIIVLFLFVVFMFDLNNTTKMINLIIAKQSLSGTNNNFITIASSGLLVALLLKSFFLILPYFLLFVNKLNFFHQLTYLYQTDLIFFFEKNNIDIISFVIYKSYSLYLIVVALLLLIAIIGSVLLVKQYKNFK